MLGELAFGLLDFVDAQPLEVGDELGLVHDFDLLGLLGNGVNEVVVVDVDGVVGVGGAADDVGDAGHVLVRGRRS